MSSFALARPSSAVAWELRGAWATGRRVSLNIEADVVRVEGHVSRVSPTGAFAVVAGLHVPLERVLAVHRPSRLGDTDHREGEEWSGHVPEAARRDPRQMELERGRGA